MKPFRSMEPRVRVIVALDVATPARAKSLVDQLTSAGAVWFKVGLQLITAGQAGTVADYVRRQGGSVFWDGKFHDIPNTVAAATHQAVDRQQASMLTVMAAAGTKALRAAADEAGHAWLLAVTVPTSMDEAECMLAYGAGIVQTVQRFADMSRDAGCAGIVCSPADLSRLKGCEELIKVTPGTRPEWAAAGDQRRIMTPGQAVAAGADFVVVGRPITAPPRTVGSPADAFQLVAADVSAAA